MPMYNLLKDSQNYSMTTGSLWNYYRDKNDGVYAIASDVKSFEYKTKILGKTAQRPHRSGNERDKNREDQPPIPPLKTEVVVSLKYLSNFWRFLDLPLISCEIELAMKWTRNCVLIEEDDHVLGICFIITSTKLYVPVVTLSINDNVIFLENIKQRFKRKHSWNK